MERLLLITISLIISAIGTSLINYTMVGSDVLSIVAFILTAFGVFTGVIYINKPIVESGKLTWGEFFTGAINPASNINRDDYR